MVITAVDDICDAYATLPEVKSLVDAFQRWDTGAVTELPSYMRIIFRTVLETVEEIGNEMRAQGKSDSVQQTINETCSSSSSTERNLKNVVLCSCEKPARILKSWTDDNPGRRFFTCAGRKVGSSNDSCNFFRWFDMEKPQGWQHLALLEARDVMREQKEEIMKLKASLAAINSKAVTEAIPNSNLVVDELKRSCDNCGVLEREVLVLNEWSRVYRNVLISSTVGFSVAFGIMVAMWKY